MKILFLSHYFPPEVNAPATRTFEHCREWARLGHEVTVVTCAPNHPRGKLYPGYKNRLIQRETLDGIQVIRLWTYLTANEGFLKRTLNYVSYMAAVTLAVPWLPKADVVVSTSPQFFNGLAGYTVSRLKRRPWVLEIRDLWPESILAVGAIRNRTLIRLLEWLEAFAYRKADRIVPVTDAFERYMVERGVEAHKIQVIKNGVDLRFFSPHVDGESLAADLGLTGKFVAAYIGTHGMAHHLETILEAAASIDHPDIVFLLVGDGAERRRLLETRDRLGLRSVLMLEQLPKATMPALLSLTDVSLVLLKDMELFRTVIPSKIFESMAMKRPIVLGVEGESRDLVGSADAGLFVEPENAAQLAEAVVRLADDPALCRRLGENGRAFVEQHFDRRVLAERYAAVLGALVQGRGVVKKAGWAVEAGEGGDAARRPPGEE